MEVKINTLTPLWTGGVDTGKCDRIHETGILGSLRWWMEVLVRGLGSQVSDPTSEKPENRSGFDQKKYHESQATNEQQRLRDAGLCDVSQIFGATGWKRRFRFEVQEVDVSDASIKHPIKANRTYTDKQNNQKTPTWYFPNSPKCGSFVLQVQSLHPDFKPEVIGGLIQFIADRSALGARPQMGFGVIEVEGSRIDTQPLYDWLITTAGSNTYPADLPSLQNIFLAQIQSKDSNPPFKEEDTFNLKYDLRQLFRVAPGKPDNLSQLRHFIMGAAPDDKDKKKDGEAEDKRMAAKIKISRPYIEDGKLTIRVWGWIPENAVISLKDGRKKDLYTNGWDRGKVVGKIHEHLAANYILLDWREMNSVRDTVKPKEGNVQVFLHSLLGLQEGSDAV